MGDVTISRMHAGGRNVAVAGRAKAARSLSRARRSSECRIVIPSRCLVAPCRPHYLLLVLYRADERPSLKPGLWYSTCPRSIIFHRPPQVKPTSSATCPYN
ncbi:hypothetical protein DM49_2379 [Burkholderia mallei]|nr:hypothetical protein DM53_3952 [Burkholderia mallei]KOS91469.1 hypothetical protein DM45_2518 [Burkholderia mallei]KOS94861.1 hypothetical protein DM49_2379 [Burkholderia mallei]KOT18836.1 hypothetical protein DM52_1171 [Burkholderia mallei]